MKDPYLDALGLNHLDTEEKYEAYARALSEESAPSSPNEYVISQLTIDTLYQLAAVLLQKKLHEVDGEVAARLFTSYAGMRQLTTLLPESQVRFQGFERTAKSVFHLIEELRVKADSLLNDSARWSLDKIQEEKRSGGQI